MAYAPSDKPNVIVKVSTKVTENDVSSYVFPTVSVCDDDCTYEIDAGTNTPVVSATSYTPGTPSLTITVSNVATSLTGSPT